MNEAIRIDTVSVHRAGVPTPGRRAYRMLHFGFVLIPLVAGVDKMVGLMTHWSEYLAPAIVRASPVGPELLMRAIGVVEIAAALLVALRPRVGAYVVAAWLCAIIANIVLLRAHYDIALRDFGLVLGALALGRLAQVYDVASDDTP